LFLPITISISDSGLVCIFNALFPNFLIVSIACILTIICLFALKNSLLSNEVNIWSKLSFVVDLLPFLFITYVMVLST